MHFVSADGFLQGKIDLAAPDDGGVAALDVKTGGGDAEALRRKADTSMERHASSSAPSRQDRE